MRRSLLATGAISLLVALALAGCGDDGSGSTNGTSGPPADLVVKAESLEFDSDTYTAAAGSNVIEYVNDDSQLHTLLIEDVQGFKLRVTSKGDEDRDTTELDAGTYTLYCDVPGHRDGGMEAELTVS